MIYTYDIYCIKLLYNFILPEVLMKKVTITLTLLLSIVCALPALWADGDANDKGEVKEGLYLNTNLGASVNKLGLAMKADLFYRIPLIDKPGVLWKTTKLDVGVQEYFSPSFQRASVFVKVEPIAVFDVVAYAGYDYMYDGNNDTFGPGFMKFDETDDYDSDDRKDVDGIAKGGFRLLVVPTFKVAFGPVAALYSFSIEYHDYNYDGYYYDYSTFILQKGEDTSFTHDVKLLYKLGPYNNIGTFRVGVNFTDMWVKSNEKNSMKMAAMIVYQPKWSFQGERMSPYFVTMMGSHIQDKYYEGKFYFALLMGLSYKLY